MELYVNKNDLSQKKLYIQNLGKIVGTLDMNVSLEKTTGEVAEAIKDYSREMEKIKNEVTRVCNSISKLVEYIDDKFTEVDFVSSQAMEKLGK